MCGLWSLLVPQLTLLLSAAGPGLPRTQWTLGDLPLVWFPCPVAPGLLPACMLHWLRHTSDTDHLHCYKAGLAPQALGVLLLCCTPHLWPHSPGSLLPLVLESREALGCLSCPSWFPTAPHQLGQVHSGARGCDLCGRTDIEAREERNLGVLLDPAPFSAPGVVEIRSVHVGTVVIKAVYSGFYVAMNHRGRLYGSVSTGGLCGQWMVGGSIHWPHTPPLQRVYTVDCRFRERIEENGYNTYASLRWRHHGRPMFLALDGRGSPRQGGRTRRHHLSSHFLPVLVS
jgi:hypothetical protein